MTYYVLYSTLLAAAWGGRASRQLRVLLYWCLLITLFLFVGLRLDVGCDYDAYFGHFFIGNVDAYAEALVRRDPGHWVLIKFLNDRGLNYQSLNLVASGIFFLGAHVMARRQPDPLAFLVLCFPILIVNMPMSATRQAFAIGFMFLAFVAFLDRRVILYAVWILIGSAFHSSILLFLLLTPFVLGRFSRRNVLLGVLLALPGMYALAQTDSAELAESRYIDSGIDAAGAAFRLAILSLSGVFFLIALAPAWRRQFPDDYKLAAIGSWMLVSFFLLFFVSSVIGDRFGYYLIPIQAMIFARIPYLPLGHLRQVYAFVPYAALTLVFVVWTQLSWHFNVCYIPYRMGLM